MMAAYVYMVECGDGTYYTGWTYDVNARVAAHNAGRGARYTRGRGPVRLVYRESCPDKSAAQRREWEIKQMNRVQKERLVRRITPITVSTATDNAKKGVTPCTAVQPNQEV
jgi:putative endonuclease